MKTPANPIALALTDDLRPGLRRMAAWTISLDAWLESTSSAEARSLSRESFLEEIDRVAWALLLAVVQTTQTPDDYAEALKAIFPIQDEEKEAGPLTREERDRLLAWAEEVTAEATDDASPA